MPKSITKASVCPCRLKINQMYYIYHLILSFKYTWLVNCLCELPEALPQKDLFSACPFLRFWKWWTTSIADVESWLVHLQSVFKNELYLRFITVVANEVTSLFGGDSRGGLWKLSLLPIIAPFFSYSRWEGRGVLKYT